MGPGSIVIKPNPVLSGPPQFTPVTFVQGQWMEQSYNHTSRAMGGDWDMSFTIEGPKTDLEDKVQDFLGKEVVVYSGDGQRVVWGGMITGLVLNLPNLRVEYNLDTLVNSAWARYTLASGGTDTGITAQVFDAVTAVRTQSEAASGGATFTRSNIFSDSPSIFRWGIKEGVLQLGLCPTAAVADYAAEVYKDKYKNPQPSFTVQAGTMGNERPSLQIIASGWFRTLYWQTYNFIDDPPILRSVETMIDRITTTSGTFVRDLYDSASGLTVTDQYGMDRTAADCLLDLARLGKSNGRRKLVWMDHKRDFYYDNAIQADAMGRVKYRISTAKGVRMIQGQNGWIDPSEVKPREWIMAEDILTYLPLSISDSDQVLLDDPRVGYVEEIQFREPNQISIVPSASGQLENILALMTLMSGLNSM